VNALITGANGGLGTALVLRLLSRGWTVTALVRGGASRFPERPGLTVLDVDLLTWDGRPLVDGPLHALVNIAGSSVYGPVCDIDADELRRLLELNAVAPYRLVQAHLPQLVEGRGTVVQTSSLAAAVPLPFYGAYAASKLALEGWSEALRHEVAGLGVRVVCVQPGSFATGVRDRIRFVELRRLPGLAPFYERFRAVVLGRGLDDGADPADFAAHVEGVLRGRTGALRQPIGPGAWATRVPWRLRDLALRLWARWDARQQLVQCASTPAEERFS
jgi:NAD(P)-dependent dehydrogenase (short-subunit alcohol dehydrogenase family)